ncbi:MAG TPA: PDZ domain-containing protein [Planctomycetota bacterium]|nr:PDZ domain-containing protein [Planctomycetota bacterium]
MTLIATMMLALFLQDQESIPDWIKKLGSDDFATREQATEALKKAGKAAKDPLQKAAQESDDPEVRQRAKDILEEMAKPQKFGKSTVPAPLPGRPGVRGSSVSVRSVNGDTTYQITPFDGSAVLNFEKAASGKVKLITADDQGQSSVTEAASLEAFLKDHKELAQRFGITEEGIDYAGSRVSFKGGALVPNFRFSVPQRPGRVAPPPAEEPESTPVAGALLTPLDDSLRSQLEIPEGQGAVVSKVAPGSVAEALGLKKNDVLLEIDGRKLASPDAAKGAITKDSALLVLRKGKKETLAPKKDF